MLLDLFWHYYITIIFSYQVETVAEDSATLWNGYHTLHTAAVFGSRSFGEERQNVVLVVYLIEPVDEYTQRR